MAKRVFLEFEHDIEAFEKKVDELNAQQAEAQSTGRSKADEFLPSFHGILSFSYGLY